VTRIDPKQARYLRAARALLTARNVTAAAAESGISRPTLVRYRRDPAFQALLRSEADEVYGESTARLRAAVSEALDVLLAAMRSDVPLPWSKIHAASRVWELATRSAELNFADELDMLQNTQRVILAELERIEQERPTAWPGSTASG
jgi:hypothetical protein